MRTTTDKVPPILPESQTPSYVDVERAQVPDSGYVTQSTSLDSKPAEPFPSKRHIGLFEGLFGLNVPPDLADLADLAEFDKAVDDHTLSRFHLVQSQIEKPLLDYVRRKTPRKRYRPIALRLMVLGRNQDDAKPCIVVFCPEEQCKRVRKFFDKSHVMALCRPKEGTEPSFDVFVRGRAPETKHGDEDVDIFIPIVGGREGYTDETYCGAPIIVQGDSSTARRCTFGGIISTASRDGEIRLYGLTVGHVLLDDSDNDLALDDWDFQFSDSESEDEPDEVIEPKPEETESLPGMDDSQLASEGNHGPFASWASSTMSKIGYIAKDSLTQIATPNMMGEDAGGYYDWALIEMKQLKPNLIRPRKLPNGEIRGKDIGSGDLLMPTTPPCSNGKRQSVTLLSGSGGLKQGSLSPLPSRLLLGPGNAFVDTLILNLDDDQEIQDGDSGSWVVNEVTLEVYGYVVAADSFGGGYVIPLLEAFRSIGASLGSFSVRLAITADMAAVKLEGDPYAACGLPSPFQEAEQHDEQANVSLNIFKILIAQKSNPPTRVWQPDSGYSSMDK
ncbi:hypothetical protein CEP53_008473 [Fusarium sp. AF-6]|nr:hypothetical protein CEP53_008473 [Fusarium sp. AF-6]